MYILTFLHNLQWHVDDGCDSPGGGGQSGGVVPLPCRAAGLVNVHVGVHDSWHDDVISGVYYL